MWLYSRPAAIWQWKHWHCQPRGDCLWGIGRWVESKTIREAGLSGGTALTHCYAKISCLLPRMCVGNGLESPQLHTGKSTAEFIFGQWGKNADPFHMLITRKPCNGKQCSEYCGLKAVLKSVSSHHVPLSHKKKYCVYFVEASVFAQQMLCRQLAK